MTRLPKPIPQYPLLSCGTESARTRRPFSTKHLFLISPSRSCRALSHGGLPSDMAAAVMAFRRLSCLTCILIFSCQGTNLTGGGKTIAVGLSKKPLYNNKEGCSPAFLSQNAKFLQKTFDVTKICEEYRERIFPANPLKQTAQQHFQPSKSCLLSVDFSNTNFSKS